MKKKLICLSIISLMCFWLFACNSCISCIDDNNGIVSQKDMKPRLIQTTSSDLDVITKECIPSVVAISAINSNYQSVGSGVCVADGGIIVTNYHVVSNSDNINLYLASGKICSATLLWKDKSLDIALLKSNNSIPWLKIADVGSYSIGEEVIAIGTPLDLNFRHTVTKGVISAINRTVQVEGENGYSQMSHLLQHDASINPGNSGGPLINSRGEIIGINTIKVEDAEGMGFAIVCDTISPVIENYTKNGTHSNGYLGVFGYDVSLESFGSSEYGLKVVSIDSEGPLGDFDIPDGSIITKINGKKVSDYLMLKKELYTHKIGEKVELEIKSSGETFTYNVVLAERKYD